MVPGTHGTTYGGNPLAVAVGTAVLDHLTAPGFLENVRERSAQLHGKLNRLKMKYPDLVAEVRGKGLLAGFKLGSGLNTAMRDRLRENGLLAGVAGDNTVRLAPPLNVSAAEIEQAIAIIDGALESLQRVRVAAAGSSQ
tara:strand:- start:1670 stop:2086 length:417 start_codon:yes stop_codon:yes gene_type:complete